MKNNRFPIFSILLVMLLDQTCLSIIFPVLTLVFFDTQSNLFSADTSQAVRSMWYGICIAIPHVVNMFITPILSALSDGFGRKRILLLATSGAFIFSIVGALSIKLGMLSVFIFACLVQGVFSRADPIAIAAMGDVSPKEKKVVFMGYVQTAISLGAFVGPIIGGYFATQYFISTFNFSLPYLVASVFALISFLSTVFIFKETLHEMHAHSPWSEINFKSVKKILTNPMIFQITLLLLLSQFTWRIYYQFIPPILKVNFGFDAHLLGIFVGSIAFWLALTTAFGIRFLLRFISFYHLFVFSAYLVLIGILLTDLFCLLPNFSYCLWISVIPLAVGDVLLFSCITALYSDSVEKRQQGKVMGICFIAIALMWAFTGFVGGILMSVYSLLPLIVAPIGIIIVILLLHRGFFKIEAQPNA